MSVCWVNGSRPDTPVMMCMLPTRAWVSSKESSRMRWGRARPEGLCSCPHACSPSPPNSHNKLVHILATPDQERSDLYRLTTNMPGPRNSVSRIGRCRLLGVRACRRWGQSAVPSSLTSTQSITGARGKSSWFPQMTNIICTCHHEY